MSDLYLAQANLAGFDPDWSAAVLLLDQHGPRALLAAADLVLVEGFAHETIQNLMAEAGPLTVIRLFEACRKTIATGQPADYLPLTSHPAAYAAYSDWYYRRTGRRLHLTNAGKKHRRALANLVADLRGRPPLPDTV